MKLFLLLRTFSINETALSKKCTKTNQISDLTTYRRCTVLRHRWTKQCYLFDYQCFVNHSLKRWKIFLFANSTYEKSLKSVNFASKHLEVSKNGRIFAPSNNKKTFGLLQKKSLLMQRQTKGLTSKEKLLQLWGSDRDPTYLDLEILLS